MIPDRPVDAVHDVDVVVVGSGIAGLSAALGLASKAHARRVAVITKTAAPAGGSSALAQGGIAVALGAGDSPAAHAADTWAVSGGVGDRGIVGILTREGPARVRRLIELGARFDRTPGGDLHFGREAAHGRPRILHAHGDATGAEIVRALVAAVVEHPGIELRTDLFAQDVVREGARAMGVVAVDADGTVQWWRAPEVVLATGGIGQLYRRTTNPVEVTGDGLAMAARAGARLVDVEFVQFHPTALAAPGADPLPLLTEALRGEGAILVDEAGRRFMPALHPDAELAPRDVVARAIHAQIRAGTGAYLDARACAFASGRAEAFAERFPTVLASALAHGIDPRREPMPVSPAAHYHMGGVMVDADGRTSVSGLWACGETASTGAHGANRLASNSLLEGLVFGARVAESIARGGRERSQAPLERIGESVLVDGLVGRRSGLAGSDLGARRDALREAAWLGLGLERDRSSIAGARAAIADVARTVPEWRGPGPGPGQRPGSEPRPKPRPGGTRDELELANLALVGQLVAAAADIRSESRGAHFRTDHPVSRPEWRRRIVLEVRGDRVLAFGMPSGGDDPTHEGDGAGERRRRRAVHR